MAAGWSSRRGLRLRLSQSPLGCRHILKAGFPNATKQSRPSTTLGLADVHLGMTCGGSWQGAWSRGHEAPTRMCTHPRGPVPVPAHTRECTRAYPPRSWAPASPLLPAACVWESTPPAPPSAGAVHSSSRKFLAGWSWSVRCVPGEAGRGGGGAAPGRLWLCCWSSWTEQPLPFSSQGTRPPSSWPCARGQHWHLLQLLVPPGADPLRERLRQRGCRPRPGGPAAGRSSGGLLPHRLSSAAALPLVAVEWPTTSPGAGFPHLDGVMRALLRCCVKTCACRQWGGGRGDGVLAEPKCVPLGFRVALPPCPTHPSPVGPADRGDAAERALLRSQPLGPCPPLSASALGVGFGPLVFPAFRG